jgi:hypothetical protein
MLKCFVIFALASSTYAQSISGSIVGSVVDPSGLPVAGATVTLTETATSGKLQVPTDEGGRFTFAGLLPGKYGVSIEMSGFKRLEQRSINLTAGERLTVGEMRLEVGALVESVEVSAQGTPVQTASAERAGVVTGSQVEALAIRGRNVTSLLQLLSGVVDTSDPEQIQSNWTINALGNRLNTNNLSLDGATLNAIGNNNNSVVNVGMDAVAEVKVLLSNYQAEYGRMSGANIQIVTKSGTREFHGLASFFKRHEEFNANTFFNNRTVSNGVGVPKPRYRYNTWNYNIGGPVYIPGKFNRDRNKLFLFWSQEYWPLKVTGNLTQLTVPTALERAGDFSQTLDVSNKLVAINDPNNNKQPFPGNKIPANRLDPNGVAILSVFPAPNFTNRAVSLGNYNYLFQEDRRTPFRTETLKTDYRLTDRDLFSLNFTHRRDENNASVGASAPMSNWPRMRQVSVNDGRVLIAQYRKIFSPTLISETSMGYSWRPWNSAPNADDIKANQKDTVGYKLAQFTPANNPLNIVPQATFGGVPSPANLTSDGRFPLTTGHDIFTASSNLTKIAGPHSLKAGIYADRVGAYNQNGVAFNGLFDFARNVNNPLDSNYAYSNGVLGIFNSYTEPSSRPYPTAVARNTEFFVQDNWKLTRRLVLDFGMRIYFIRPSYVVGNTISTFTPERFDRAKQVQLVQPAMVDGKRAGVSPVNGQVYNAQLIGAIAPGAGNPANGLVVPAQDPTYPGGLIDNRGASLGPRVGFAYDVFGNGRTAVRGGFGMFYNRVAQSSLLYPYAEQAPIVQNPVINFGTMATLLNSSGLLFPGNILGIARGGQVPTIMNYSFSVQQNVGFGTVVDVAYVGSLGRHLLWQRNLNYLPFGTNFNPANIDKTTNSPLSPAFLRQYPGFNDINYREWGSTSSYHSMQVSANRRFARGVQFGGSWTWSKAMDFADTDTDTVSTQVPVRVWNYGLASFDRTHVLKINWLWTLPKARAKNVLAKAVLNNWQVSGIASFVSGAPTAVGFTTVNAVDITGSSTDGARVVVTGDPVLSKGDQTFYRFFDTSVFRVPAVGTIGNSARTLFRGPGINNWDLAVFKDFPVRERMGLQFRWELYNAFNHTQFSGLDTTARFDATGAQVNSRFGQFTAAREPRKMQFALRFHF